MKKIIDAICSLFMDNDTEQIEHESNEVPVVVLESATYSREGRIVLNYSDGSSETYEMIDYGYRKLPLMQTPHGSIRYKLNEIERYVNRYGNPYPTAHLTKENEGTQP